MRPKEEVIHLERKISQLEQHVAEQDAEIFRMAKRLDKLTQRCTKLEGRIGADSPVDPDRTPTDDKPPHY